MRNAVSDVENATPISEGPVNRLDEPIPHSNDEKRHLTDIDCLFVFLIFIVIWIVIGIYAIRAGDVDFFFKPTDSYGRLCGKDEGLRNRPYLFFFNTTECLEYKNPDCKYLKICVDQCPKKSYDKEKDDELDPRYCDEITQECPKFYLPSEPVNDKCVPYVSSSENHTDEGGNSTNSNSTRPVINKAVILSGLQMIGHQFIDNIYKILFFLVLPVCLSIAYLVVLRWVATISVYLSIIILFIILLYQTMLNIIFVIGLIVFVVILLFARRRIKLAIELIRESSKTTSAVMSVYFFPLFLLILQAGVQIFFISTLVLLFTIRHLQYRLMNVNATDGMFEPTWGHKCDPNNFDNSTHPKMICAPLKQSVSANFLQFFNLVTSIWATFFLSDFGVMVMALVISKWFWTKDKTTLPYCLVFEATRIVATYHLGTIALGSAIITICTMLKEAMKLRIERNRAEGRDSSRFNWFFFIFEWFERILKHLCQNAYIICAIYGENFFSSGRKAVKLIARNLFRVIIIIPITYLLLLIFGCLVLSIVIIIALTFFNSNGEINYAFWLVVVYSILIIYTIFKSYSIALNTLFLCFLEDCELNDGSPERPYFMSPNLRQILLK